MKVRLLALRNFRRHRDTRVELPDGVTAVFGPNGAGKSSLLEAIAFALYGTDAIRTSKHQLRSESAPPADPVQVELQFEAAGHAVTILRELKGKGLTPSATLTIDGQVAVPPGAGSNEAATDRVARLLGMDRDALFATLVARQGELARLSDHTPADRKRLVLRMLGVERVDHAIESAREQRRAAQALLEALRRLLQDLGPLEAAVAHAQAAEAAASQGAGAAAAAHTASQARLLSAQSAAAAARTQAEAARHAQSTLDVAQREAHLRKEAEARAAKLVADAEAAEALARQLAPAASQVEPLQEQLHAALQTQAAARARVLQVQAIERLQSEAARAEADLQRLQAEVAQATPTDPEAAAQRVARLDQEGAILQARVADLQARLARLTGLDHAIPCPTCDRPLEGHLEDLRRRTSALLEAARQDHQQWTQERLAAAAEHAQAESRRRHAEARTQQHAVATARRDQHLTQLQQARAALVPEPAVPDVARLKADLATAQAAQQQWMRALDLARQLPGLRAEAKAQGEKRAAAEAQAEALKGQLAQLGDPLGAARAAESALAAAALQERQAERGHAEAVRALDLARGAAASAVARLAAERERHAQAAACEADLRSWTALVGLRNDGLLDRFRDHLVDRIGPATQAEASRLLATFTGGRYTELVLDGDYQVFVADHGVMHSLDRFSGGEADLVHLALRLAVSRLLAQRSGAAELRFLALDEVFGHLDRDRRGLVVDALHGLGTLYDQVLVVSHLEDLQDSLDNAIRVHLDGDVAVASVRSG